MQMCILVCPTEESPISSKTLLSTPTLSSAWRTFRSQHCCQLSFLSNEVLQTLKHSSSNHLLPLGAAEAQSFQMQPRELDLECSTFRTDRWACKALKVSCKRNWARGLTVGRVQASPCYVLWKAGCHPRLEKNLKEREGCGFMGPT